MYAILKAAVATSKKTRQGLKRVRKMVRPEKRGCRNEQENPTGIET
jgi:hypothetical protein